MLVVWHNVVQIATSKPTLMMSWRVAVVAMEPERAFYPTFDRTRNPAISLVIEGVFINYGSVSGLRCISFSQRIYLKKTRTSTSFRKLAIRLTKIGPLRPDKLFNEIFFF